MKSGGEPPLSSMCGPLLAALLILALLYTLYLASGLLIPVAFAIFLSILLFPVVRGGNKLHIPPFVTAGLSVFSIMAVTFLAMNTLLGPAEAWLEEAPTSIRQINEMSDASTFGLDQLKAAADELEKLMQTNQVSQSGEPLTVVVADPGLLQSAMVNLPSLLTKILIVLLLTFFLLMGGRSWSRKLLLLGASWGERRQIVRIGQAVHRELASYLATVSLINISLGGATAAYLWFMDIPNPLLWGALVATFNFAPYVGAIVSALLLTVVGLTEINKLPEALLVPLGFLVLTTLEGQLITPMILGARSAIAPGIVFLAVVVGAWMWGVAGAVMAVPFLVSLKSLSRHYPPLNPLVEVLAKDPATVTE